MITALVVLLVGVIAFGVGYQWGHRRGGEAMYDDLEEKELLVDEIIWEPLPEGFVPSRDGGRELDDRLPLVEVVPSYYVYDEHGEATGEHKELPEDEKGVS